MNKDPRRQNRTDGTTRTLPEIPTQCCRGHLATLERFYGQLLGWKLDADNPAHYGLVDTGADGGIPGGIYAPGDAVGQYVRFYADVKDVESLLAHAEQLGFRP